MFDIYSETILCEIDGKHCMFTNVEIRTGVSKQENGV